jgi:hypothetical protein
MVDHQDENEHGKVAQDGEVASVVKKLPWIAPDVNQYDPAEITRTGGVDLARPDGPGVYS